jgi:hypothetical protein
MDIDGKRKPRTFVPGFFLIYYAQNVREKDSVYMSLMRSSA